MKTSALALATLLATASHHAMADISDIKAANNQFGIRLISTNVDYKETGGTYGSTPGTMDSESGNVPGFSIFSTVMADVLPLGNDQFTARYSRTSGNTNYVGSYIGCNAGYGSVHATDSATMNDYSFSYGKGFVMGQQFMATPYVELGHHQWDRGLNSYTETYAHSYYGIGARLQYSPVANLVLSANALYGKTFKSSISTSQSQFFSGSLGNSRLTNYGLSLDYAFTQTLHASLAYSISNFKYGYSAVSSAGYFEPNSSTSLRTVEIGIGCNF
jgi:hypothetical protein